MEMRALPLSRLGCYWHTSSSITMAVKELCEFIHWKWNLQLGVVAIIKELKDGFSSSIDAA